MNLSARRRDADLAEMRAHSKAVAYRTSAQRLRQHLRRDWKLPLAVGMSSGIASGLLPVVAILRTGSGLLRLAAYASQVSHQALVYLARNAR